MHIASMAINSKNHVYDFDCIMWVRPTSWFFASYIRHFTKNAVKLYAESLRGEAKGHRALMPRIWFET